MFEYEIFNVIFSYETNILADFQICISVPLNRYKNIKPLEIALLDFRIY